ncbi:hypothetical protein MGI18_15315 [Bacillus sp. OVS6]|nr:hypothetical protein MGI18_15315 [Bacillus sp. OVS6]
MQFVQVISTTIKNAMIDFHQFIKCDSEAIETIALHHKRIFESISSGTPNLSNEYMLQHLTFVESILHKSLHQRK